MYPSKVGEFPPIIDLGVQPAHFTKNGQSTTEMRRVTAMTVRPIELPEILADLRRAVMGDGEATPAKERAFLSAALAAMSNALWQVT